MGFIQWTGLIQLESAIISSLMQGEAIAEGLEPSLLSFVDSDVIHLHHAILISS